MNYETLDASFMRELEEGTNFVFAKRTSKNPSRQHKRRLATAVRPKNLLNYRSGPASGYLKDEKMAREDMAETVAEKII